MTNWWEFFDTKWLSLLLKYDIPFIHLKDAISIARKKGWDIPKLNDVLAEFAAAIRESNLVGIGVGVHMEAWREVPKELRDRLGDAQIFCCSRVVRRILDRLETVGLRQEKITIIFDQDFEFARRRLRLFEELKKRFEPIRERVVQYRSPIAGRFIRFRRPTCSHGKRAGSLLIVPEAENRRSDGRSLWLCCLPVRSSSRSASFWTKEWFDQEIPKVIASWKPAEQSLS